MQPNENNTPVTDSAGNLPVSPAVSTGLIGGANPETKAPEAATPPLAADASKVVSDVKSEVQSEVSEEVPELRQEVEQLKQQSAELLHKTNSGSLGNIASHEVALVKLKAQELNVWIDQLLAKIKK
jgi:hypothetical protein